MRCWLSSRQNTDGENNVAETGLIRSASRGEEPTMSAFTVSSEHVAVLVHAGLWSPLRPLTWAVPTPDGELPIDGNAYNGIIPGWRPFSRARQLTAASADAVGQMLLDQNIASVNDTYNDDDLAIYTHQRPRSIHRQPVEILKAISCYRYQADATDNWSTSEAFHFCTVLETATIEKLPGWENAAWAIGHDTPILTEQRADTA